MVIIFIYLFFLRTIELSYFSILTTYESAHSKCCTALRGFFVVKSLVIYFWTYTLNLTNFNFKIINFPNMCSNIPASPAYGVYISQSIRYARASSKYSDFLKRHLYLRNRLLEQGYIFRYQDLVEIYSVSADDGERWIFI